MHNHTRPQIYDPGIASRATKHLSLSVLITRDDELIHLVDPAGLGCSKPFHCLSEQAGFRQENRPAYLHRHLPSPSSSLHPLVRGPHVDLGGKQNMIYVQAQVDFAFRLVDVLSTRPRRARIFDLLVPASARNSEGALRRGKRGAAARRDGAAPALPCRRRAQCRPCPAVVRLGRCRAEGEGMRARQRGPWPSRRPTRAVRGPRPGRRSGTKGLSPGRRLQSSSVRWATRRRCGDRRLRMTDGEDPPAGFASRRTGASRAASNCILA